MSVVENIKEICAKSGTTVPKLEKELGFGNGTIYNWAKSSPSIEKIQKVADHFNVSVERILYGFELSKFEELVRIIVGQKTAEDVAKASGVDVETLEEYLMGIRIEQPDIDFVEKLARYNPYEVLVSNEDLFEIAGHSTSVSDSRDIAPRRSPEIHTIAAHHAGGGVDWTDEELEEIEQFKKFVLMKRKQQE